MHTLYYKYDYLVYFIKQKTHITSKMKYEESKNQ